MRLPRLSRSKKSRKYPVQRDQEGKSLRARCIERFNQNRRPAEVAKELNMPTATAQRYFRDWKILSPSLERLYAFVKGLLKKNNPEREKNIDLFALTLGIRKSSSKLSFHSPMDYGGFLRENSISRCKLKLCKSPRSLIHPSCGSMFLAIRQFAGSMLVAIHTKAPFKGIAPFQDHLDILCSTSKC